MYKAVSSIHFMGKVRCNNIENVSTAPVNTNSSQFDKQVLRDPNFTGPIPSLSDVNNEHTSEQLCIFFSEFSHV